MPERVPTRPGPRIQGIFTPNVVPLHADGTINEPELRRYVDWLIDNGVHGLYPNGSTGEFTRFTPEERQRIVKIVCEQTAGRVPVLAGAAEANVRETLAACERYAEYGARAVAIVSPFYFKLCPESVYAYFREIALHSPIDVTLYNIPMFASPIDVPTIQRLAEFERIVGIKDSSGDVAFMMRMMSAVRPIRPDFAFLTGWDVVLVPMLLIGCDGGTNAVSGVAPELTRMVYDLTLRRPPRRSHTVAVSHAWNCLTRCSIRPIFPRAFARRWSCAASRWAAAASRKPTSSRSTTGCCKTCCSAFWRSLAMSTPRLAAARRGRESLIKTASVTSRPPS